MKEILTAVLCSGAVVAVIEGVREAVAWRRSRKARREDRAEEKAEKQVEERIGRLEEEVAGLTTMMKNLVESQKNVLFDRIQYLARKYIADGEIDFDDLRGVNALHSSYHNGLGGNGDLDALMKQVRELPLKPKGGS